MIFYILGLQSFCIYASIGLACIFFLQVSWLVAWLVLDERRIENNKNGLLPCIVHQSSKLSVTENHNNNNTSDETKEADVKIEKLVCVLNQIKQHVKESDIKKVIRNALESCISSVFYSAVVICLSSGFLAVGVYGLIQIKYNFDPLVLVPSDSYFSRFLEVNDQYFSPLRGYKANIYFEKMNSSHLEKIDWVNQRLENLVAERQVIEKYNFWWKEFLGYMDRKSIVQWRNMTNHDFHKILADFLFSQSGSRYQKDFVFEDELSCGTSTPPILVSSLEIEYIAFDGPKEHIPGKAKIDSILNDSQLQGAFSFNKIYLAWETDTIIGKSSFIQKNHNSANSLTGYELWRNIGLGLLCIFCITFLLLANIQVSFMVMIMVFVTLVDIAGFLYLWNVHIDIVSCINIVISVGLCVDYSVHIGHAYLVASGEIMIN